MAKNTIKLKDYLQVVEEATAASAITPGMLVEFTSAGTVQPHSTEDGPALVAFATEDEFQGKTIADAYTTGSKVQVWIPQRGDQVYALLAGGEDISIGEKLVSNGDGALKAYASASDADSGKIIGESLETLANGASSNVADARIMIRIY